MNKLSFQIVACCVLLVAIPSMMADVNFSDCGSTHGTVTKVEITDCGLDKPRCILKRNTNATIGIEFVAKKDSDDLKVDVHGVILDIPTPFAMPNPDACSESGIECPIKNENTYKYTTTMPILKVYPRVTVDIKFELKSGDDVFVCVLIPAKLQ